MKRFINLALCIVLVISTLNFSTVYAKTKTGKDGDVSGDITINSIPADMVFGDLEINGRTNS